MLKGKLDNDAYGKLDESVQAFYKKDGDSYVLQAEGVVTKDKLDEFRENNIELKNKLAEFDGLSVDEFKSMKQELKEIKMSGMGDDEKLDVLKSDYEAKLETARAEVENAQNQISELQNVNNQTISKFEIQGAAQKAFSEHKIRPEAQEHLMNSINSKFTIKDGVVVAMDGDKIVAGSNGNLTVSEYIANQDDFLKIPSSGGFGNGGGGDGNSADKSSTDKIASGLTKLVGG